ncbi:carbohydrate-binding module family 18 [Trichoderma barbatum]
MFGFFHILIASLATLWAEHVHGAALFTRDPTARSYPASSSLLLKRDDLQTANGSFSPLSINAPISEDGRCGANFGTRCQNDECCSSAGWCGTGFLYCSAPACQFEYGPYCDANRRPDGPNTEDWPRNHVGDVPYGKAIFHCSKPGTVALTFDDGPWQYTEELLDILEENGVRATFFITGRNLGKGAINDPSTDWTRLIHRMKADGHQIGSHTWSHQRLPTVGKSRLRQQMIYNEIAIADILGVFPTYMRPPYSASNEDVDRWLGELGYHITYFDLDTEGYLHEGEEAIEISQDIARKAFDGKDEDTDSYLHIEHDTVANTVRTLVPYTIDVLYRAGFTPVTVGECLGDPEENWYRSPEGGNEKRSVELAQGDGKPSFTPNRSHPAINASLPLYHPAPTTDGRCGHAFGNTTCLNQKIENCCSKTGWCGSTESHCLDGCQEGFGRCGIFG